MGLYEDLAKQAGLSVVEFKAKIALASNEEAKVRQVEINRVKAENLALSGKRDALAEKCKSAIKALNLDGEIAKLKCVGVQYTVDRIEPKADEPDLKITGGCVLMGKIATKSVGVTNGGNRGGKLKDEFDSNATPAERAALDKAIAEAHARGTTRVDGIENQHRNRVHARLVAEGKAV